MGCDVKRLKLNTMYAIVFFIVYLITCTLGAIVTQFTGDSGRSFREAILVWWFFPLVFFYFFSALIFEGPKELVHSMREFRNEMLNT